MPLLKINADGAHLPEGTRQALTKSLGQLPHTAPVIICVHGYKFSPSTPAHDPHRHILALDPDHPSERAVSWPRALGFGTRTPDEGLCIALGWEARRSIWRAYRQARLTGEALARLIWMIDRPVQLIGHSLGARVLLSALPHVHAGAVQRAILLAAAEFQSSARTALETEAGEACEVLNITTRENDLFDRMFEMSLTPDHLCCESSPRSLGRGLGQALHHWADIQIDAVGTRRTLSRMGFDIAPPERKICHWSPYLRRGVFDFYRSALRQPEHVPLRRLRTQHPEPLVQDCVDLLALRRRAFPLSFSRNVSS